jgi:hypothetical protein
MSMRALMLGAKRFSDLRAGAGGGKLSRRG